MHSYYDSVLLLVDVQDFILLEQYQGLNTHMKT